MRAFQLYIVDRAKVQNRRRVGGFRHETCDDARVFPDIAGLFSKLALGARERRFACVDGARGQLANETTEAMLVLPNENDTLFLFRTGRCRDKTKRSNKIAAPGTRGAIRTTGFLSARIRLSRAL